MQARKFDVVALGKAMVKFNQATAGQPNYLQGDGAVSPLPRPKQVEALL